MKSPQVLWGPAVARSGPPSTNLRSPNGQVQGSMLVKEVPPRCRRGLGRWCGAPAPRGPSSTPAGVSRSVEPDRWCSNGAPVARGPPHLPDLLPGAERPEDVPAAVRISCPAHERRPWSPHGGCLPARDNRIPRGKPLGLVEVCGLLAVGYQS